MSEFYKGDDNILYIQVNENYYPVGCLTSNNLEQSADQIDTTTRDNQEWKTSRPTNKGYSIPFEGIETLNDDLPSTVTYRDLENIFINSILINYRIGSSNSKQKTGSAYITSLSEASPAGDLVSFSGVLTGFGKYVNTQPSENNLFNYELNFLL